VIQWSGQNWYERSGLLAPTVAVIERPAESYDEYAERKEREKKARRVPFGFAGGVEAEAPAAAEEAPR
jgi:hypothetical protein